MDTKFIGADAIDYIVEDRESSDPFIDTHTRLVRAIGTSGSAGEYSTKALNFINRLVNSCEDALFDRMYVWGTRRLIKKNGLPEPKRVKVLSTHGIVKHGTYVYVDIEDGKRGGFSVEDWIKENEDTYDALLLTQCNATLNPLEGGMRLEPREKTTLLYPAHKDSIFYFLLAQLGIRKDNYIIEPSKNLYAPYYGELEKIRYSLEHVEIEKYPFFPMGGCSYAARAVKHILGLEFVVGKFNGEDHSLNRDCDLGLFVDICRDSVDEGGKRIIVEPIKSSRFKIDENRCEWQDLVSRKLDAELQQVYTLYHSL